MKGQNFMVAVLKTEEIDLKLTFLKFHREALGILKMPLIMNHDEHIQFW